MKAVVVALRAAAPIIARDTAGVAGMAMITRGAAEIYGPVGWIVGGVQLLAMVLLIARRG